MVEPTLEQIQKWKNNKLIVKHMRMDNACENKKLQQRAESNNWKFDISFKYTARNTPQQNYLAELGFAVLANKGRAMMYRANVPKAMCYQIFPKAFETATLLDGLVTVNIDGKILTHYKHFFCHEPRFIKYLRTWGEAGTVTLKKKTTPRVGA